MRLHLTARSTPALAGLTGLLAVGLLSVPAGAVPAAGPAAAGADAAGWSTALVAERAAAPRLKVRRLVGRLDIPWDVQPVAAGTFLLTERDRRRLSLVQHGERRTVRFPRSAVWSSGETGLMSLAVSPDFATSRRFYACHGGFAGNGHDVRVTSWRLSPSGHRARGGKVLLRGIPASSGRHGGCRLLLDRRTGALLVGTGDAAVGTNPRDLGSLGGKVLRLDPSTGAPWPDNPFIGSADARTRYVLTYGHRNVQGLAQRADGSLWSVEQGSDRDDEVNLLVPGGDYGWNPVPGYNEAVPMTDPSLPGKQVPARWSSGKPTLATSGAAWVRGKQWGALEGTLAVAALKASRLLFLRFDDSGVLKRVRTPKRLRFFGRLRSVTSLPSGRLLVTTSNGGGADEVLEIRPR
ncbi:PQQ-dependent sugar dehydrogenase [Nocardioides houyundeii]|uniref:PQQ-dependent sugar dehydrogenase n=1 Tax=Nocardioides houyundeii TaxID=2045452 RepID=UPI000DF1C0BC|nr:PQQ-dependent sugar dehydrogenase [Nocardioides houyundeii]